MLTVNNLTGLGVMDVVAANLLLDSISVVAVGAWSFRKLRAAHAGPAVCIRASGNDAEEDFGFDSNGDFDAAGVEVFLTANGGTAFIKTWYDQSGSGQDLTQATFDRQPAYNASGLNGLPAAMFATDRLADTSFSPGSSTELSVFVVAESDPGVDFGRLAFYIGGTDTSETDPNSALIIYCGNSTPSSLNGHAAGVNGSSGTIAPDTPFSAASIWDGTNHTMYINNSAGTPVASTLNLDASGSLMIGARPNDANPWLGPISEVIALPDTPTADDRLLIDNSHSAYWGV